MHNKLAARLQVTWRFCRALKHSIYLLLGMPRFEHHHMHSAIDRCILLVLLQSLLNQIATIGPGLRTVSKDDGVQKDGLAEVSDAEVGPFFLSQLIRVRLHVLYSYLAGTFQTGSADNAPHSLRLWRGCRSRPQRGSALRHLHHSRFLQISAHQAASDIPAQREASMQWGG